MRPRAALSRLLTLNLAGRVFSWGDLGHRTTAYLAEQYLTEEESRAVQRITGLSDISDAAVWPDQVSQTPEYSYSASWHYINIHDDPPSTCGIEFPRDHHSGSPDILTAFANHSQVLLDRHSDAKLASEALRFLIHWGGDVHQPLHTEALKRGGNDIPVLFDGEHTTLHIVWDVHILEKHRGGVDQKAAAKAWAKELYLRDPDRLSLQDQTCSGPDKAFDCILSWATESNLFVCSSVFANDVQSLEGRELGGAYYEQNVRIVDQRIALAGKRLAWWIKMLLADAQYHNSVAMVYDYDHDQLPVEMD